MNLDDSVNALKAAADPTRLRLLALLAAGEATVGELQEVLTQSQPRVSRHLRYRVRPLALRDRTGPRAFRPCLPDIHGQENPPHRPALTAASSFRKSPAAFLPASTPGW